MIQLLKEVLLNIVFGQLEKIFHLPRKNILQQQKKRKMNMDKDLSSGENSEEEDN